MNRPHTYRSAFSAVAMCMALLFGESVARADSVTILSSGHADVFEVEYEQLPSETPTLHLGVHTDDAHYEPADVILQVKNAAYASTTGLPGGITTILGSNAWILPADTEQATTLGVLEAGAARANFPVGSGPVTFTMLAAGPSNPGNFALFTSGNVLRLSAIGGTVQSGSFSLSTGHTHFNWGFSAPGIYTFDMQASFVDQTYGLLQSAVETYKFEVVPEPSSIALAGLGAAGALVAGWRRRRRAAAENSAFAEAAR